MTMVELNEKAMEAAIDAAEATYERHEEAGAFVAAVKAAVTVYSSALPEEVVFCPQCGWNSAMDGEALPAPDDGLMRELATQAETSLHHEQQIERLARERDEALAAEDEAKDSFWAIYPDWVKMKGHGISTEAARTMLVERAEAAEQQVQKLTAESERLREALEVSRQVLAKLLSAGHNNPPATPEEIDAAFWSVDAALTQEGER